MPQYFAEKQLYRSVSLIAKRNCTILINPRTCARCSTIIYRCGFRHFNKSSQIVSHVYQQQSLPTNNWYTIAALIPTHLYLSCASPFITPSRPDTPSGRSSSTGSRMTPFASRRSSLCALSLICRESIDRRFHRYWTCIRCGELLVSARLRH